MSSSIPRNRKERRTTAQGGRSADPIPMSKPDRTKTRGKTLYDLAAEREAAYRGQRADTRSQANDPGAEPAVVTLNPDGSISGPDGERLPDNVTAKIKASMQDGQSDGAHGIDAEEADVVDEAPLAEALLYTSTLLMLYFTLTVLVMHQYGLSKDLPWSQIAWQTISNAPVLFLAIYILHPRAGSWWAQALFVTMSVACGMWMITAAHEYGYMAVMKKAPGAGTVWVWAVLESRVELACAGLLIVAGYSWYGDYSVLA